MTLTMERFNSLDVGTVVTRQARHEAKVHFELTAEGWRTNGTLVPTEFFAGDIAQGNLTIGVKLEPGQVWRNGDSDNAYQYLVLRQVPNSDSFYYAMVRTRGDFEVGTFYAIQTAAEFDMMRLHEGARPQWYETVDTMGRQIVDYMLISNRNSTAFRTAEQQRLEAEQKVISMQSVMEQWAIENNMAPDSSFGDAMERAGLSRPPAVVDVTAHVTGLTWATVAPKGVLPEGFTPQDSRVRLGFTKDVTVKAREHDRRCPCWTVTGDMIREALVHAGLRADDLVSYSGHFTCARPDHRERYF